MKKLTHKSLLTGMLSLGLLLHSESYGQAVSGIVTDYNGYWNSRVGALNAVKPNNSHNMLAFTFNGVTYSTGVNDGTLTANNVVFTASSFRALPINNISGAVNSNTKVGLGSMYDGVANGKSTPSPVNNLPLYLNDGVNGLNIGTCVANLPIGTMTFPSDNLNPDAIGDGIPDLVVTQVADPSGTAFDRYEFLDNNNVRVGNLRDIVFSSISPVGTWNADFYEASANPMTLQASFTAGDRPVRLWAADFSYFGITQANYSSIETFRVTLSGVSDVAFVAFNVAGFDANSSANTPLPVALTYFKGQTDKGNTILSWQTATEISNDRFEIEASSNGKEFQRIATIKGAGHSNALKDYTYTHRNTPTGTSYYRLKQVDTDGTSDYSSIISIRNEGGASQIGFYPNPARDFTLIQHAAATGNETVCIMDISGREVSAEKVKPGSTETRLDLTRLQKGFYQVYWTGSEGRTTKPLIVE